MLSVTTSQALCPVLSIPRVPGGRFSAPCPHSHPCPAPDKDTEVQRDEAVCTAVWDLVADLIVGKSPLGVSSTNLAVNGLGGGGQGYTPTHSCPQSQAGALLCNMYSQGGDAAGHPHDFIFAPSFHPDQRVLIVLGQMGSGLPSCPLDGHLRTSGHCVVLL